MLYLDFTSTTAIAAVPLTAVHFPMVSSSGEFRLLRQCSRGVVLSLSFLRQRFMIDYKKEELWPEAGERGLESLLGKITKFHQSSRTRSLQETFRQYK